MVNPIDPGLEMPSAHGLAGGPSGPGAGALSAFQDYPDRKLGLPPKHNQADHGGPSMSADVNASEIMQNMVMNDDDKKWYAKLFKKQAKNFLKPRNTVAQHGFEVGLNCGPEPLKAISEDTMHCLACAADLCSLHLREGKKSNLLMEPDDVGKKERNKKKPKKREASSAGGGQIQGYTAPLGNLRARKRNAKINARAFGGGSVIGKY